MRPIPGCIDMVLAECDRSAMPRSEVCHDYSRHSRQQLKPMVYTHPAVASSYHKNPAGDVPTLFDWRILDYWSWTNRPDPDHNYDR